ncbi:hypothetical protein [Pseudomonas sp. P108]|uniref:hypothetical protein n=1 Tax=Pseudomonas sp. P108 TaxID=1837993 RepID=UPI002934CCC3|nr:hypothetical protein [Pseudomonas sp. P108]WNZ87584.1 hypothetical protein QOM10_30320 [Pseudomonas sp. P108]
MNIGNITLLRSKVQPQAKSTVFPLAAFYAHLQNHDWYYCFSEDRAAYRAGEVSEQRLRKLARDSGPVHEWLWEEFSKHKGTGPAWNTPQHPMPPAPADLAFRDMVNIRIEMAKAELVAKIIASVKPFLPSSIVQLDPVWRVMQKVLYLGAYAGQGKAPAIIASHPKLAGAWEQGQELVTAKEHPTI